jgi:hypothetical protein
MQFRRFRSSAPTIFTKHRQIRVRFAWRSSIRAIAAAKSAPREIQADSRN